MPERRVIGWDVGGAHVKACVLQQGGEVVDVGQWACPLWLGMDQLAPVLRAARARWPGMHAARHAVTMTGEMVDLFADREDGVRRIAAELMQSLGGSVHFYAGDAGWCDDIDAVAARWEAIASANWLATARHAALRFGDGVLIDIGSTTTDLIAFAQGHVTTHSRSDAQRLASGELVYHGVVRTPLCALARRIAWRGTPHNVMNEFFATTADVYRLTGELNAAHDLHTSADTGAKDLPATRRRLARMIGLDARDGTADDWQAFALAWRAAQVEELGGQLKRVTAGQSSSRRATVVSAGCGAFLVRDVLENAMPEAADAMVCVDYGRDLARVSAHASPDRDTVQAWAQVCAPCVAVATLFDGDQR